MATDHIPSVICFLALSLSFFLSNNFTSNYFLLNIEIKKYLYALLVQGHDILEKASSYVNTSLFHMTHSETLHSDLEIKIKFTIF